MEIPVAIRSRAASNGGPKRKPWDDPTERAEIYTFTPEEAAYLLEERNPTNRPRNPGQVKYLSEELMGGHWRRNGETVIFDRQGYLRNGQHRLAACVETGVPLETWCVFGVEPDVFGTLDRTRRRSSGDDLAVMGEKNYYNLAATLSLIHLEEQGRLDQTWIGSNQHIVMDVLKRHPRVRAAVSYTDSRKGIRGLMPNRVASYCMYKFAELDRDAAYEFFDRLATGDMLESGNPILILRNRLIDNRSPGTKSRLKVPYILALTIKA